MVFFLYATIILKVFKTTQQKFNYVELFLLNYSH